MPGSKSIKCFTLNEFDVQVLNHYACMHNTETHSSVTSGRISTL